MRDQNLTATAQQRQSAPAPPFNFSRRYACDRCRGHKLRCVRDHMSTNSPCQRCRKAREKCTIGSNIRSGPSSMDRTGLLGSDGSGMPSSGGPGATRAGRLSLAPQAWESLDNGDGHNESLNTADVIWLDMLDTTCDIPCDLGSSAVGGGTVGEEYDTDVGGTTLTVTPTSQTTSTAPYPFSSNPDDFAFSPDFEIPGDRSTTTLEKESPSTQINQPHHKHIPQGRNGSLSNAPALAHDHTMALDLVNSPPGSVLKAPSSSGSSHQTGASNGPSKLTVELKDASIQELSDLSTSLMKDLHRVVGCKLASSFLFTRSDKSPAEYLFKTLDGSTSQENAIGRMLQGSEKFLEIMQLFNELSHPARSCPDNAQGGEVLSFNNLEECFENSEASSDAQLERRWNMIQSFLERQVPIPTTLTSESFGLSQKPDITSKLAVLTCYTCLLRIYETVFFIVHHTLEYSPALAPTIKLPQTVPGLEINGFMLRKHRSLQIKVLIQVSTYMLDSVEKSMHGMLSDPAFQALLKTVLRQEGLECSPGNETGMGSIRRLIEKVDKILT
ncbi:hypothetical protein F4777DRAFT_579984 [Nemania sp. FL0916]|nr:hypothetical protein F4777DRAFT_579984 [Nemania sp. FL0916]